MPGYFVKRFSTVGFLITLMVILSVPTFLQGSGQSVTATPKPAAH
jgi:hypothetical protein